MTQTARAALYFRHRLPAEVIAHAVWLYLRFPLRLWRAIDSNGDVLDILVQSRRNSRAAKRFFRKLFKQYGQPRIVVTDKLGSYSAALKSLAPGIDHLSHKGLNSRSEGSHRPTRRRERIMASFKSPGQAQLFLSVHDQVQTVFRPRRYKLSAPAYRQSRSDAHSIWDGITGKLKAALPRVWSSFSAKPDKLTIPVRGLRGEG